jgi:hypothetical protein
MLAISIHYVTYGQGHAPLARGLLNRTAGGRRGLRRKPDP